MAEHTGHAGDKGRPERLEPLLLLGVTLWLFSAQGTGVFPFTHGWARALLVLAAAWLVVGGCEFVSAALARRRRGAEGRRRSRLWGPLPLLGAAALVTALGIIPLFTVPPRLARPRGWPLAEQSGYRLGLTTWHERGAARYRFAARCQGARCKPLTGVQVFLAFPPRGSVSDLCEGATLHQDLHEVRCEGRLRLDADEYRRANGASADLYPRSPPADAPR
jgi:hypothetical protein